MRVLGLSPLDKDATVSLVEDGRVVYAAAEERFSRVKQHAGFPHLALADALRYASIGPEEIDVVAYPFLDAAGEERLMRRAFEEEARHLRESPAPSLDDALRAAEARVPSGRPPVHGLPSADARMRKGAAKELLYRWLGVGPLAPAASRRLSRRWLERAVRDHRRWQEDLIAGLRELGLEEKLKRTEHHVSHAANAYLASGFDRALVVTLDGYGSGLSGSIALGEGGRIARKHALRFPDSLGAFYESVTSSLGFHPDRHAGKIVGLAAYGDPDVLSDAVRTRFDLADGDLRIRQNLNVFFSRHLAARFPMIDVAAAWQHVLEVAACAVVDHWRRALDVDAVVLSGGVCANVKMNQRIHSLDGIARTFVYPNMGDGGCGTGLAMQLSWPGGVGESIRDVYLGPEYGEDELLAALEAEGLEPTRPAPLAAEVARLLHAGKVVARFAGRMEYGPRALGNRSVLYHGRDPAVNQWLNQRLGRTEFMPFAPVTLWEERERCYHGLAGAEHAAEFMTITFDCTDWMKEHCPAAVHVDGTARPQLVRREVNPEYHDIVARYRDLSGVPCLVNTSFNMHEEPIVCTPRDAVRAFLRGRIDALALGPFLVEAPSST